MIKEIFQKHKTPILLIASTGTLIVLLFVGGFFVYNNAYANFIYPNVKIGGVELDGLSQELAHQKLEDVFEAMIETGLWLQIDGDQAHIELQTNINDDPDLVHDLIYLDIDHAVEQAYSVGRSNGWIVNQATKIYLLAIPKNLEPQIVIDSDQMSKLILDQFGDWQEPMEPTDFEITIGTDIEISVVEGKDGMEFDLENTLTKLNRDAKDFQLETLVLELSEVKNDVSTIEAESLIDQVRSIIENAPYELTFTSPAQREYVWEIDEEEIADWIIPLKINGELGLVFAGEGYEELVFEIHDDIDSEPTDAKFTIEGDRVVEFQGSIDGVTFDEDTTFAELVAKLGQKDVELPITVATVEPQITTGSVNNLGITEILGVGTSNFSGSPANRIANIQHGASKLNGILIAPGETLSLLEQLRPFTVADGYLPELVIKGDEIKPEVGGGLCQIGTTTFRAVMNAGLEVVERRNHSLVVSYYNDPNNNNPGTDATIYDPAPDFKFKNDTENYVLFTTEVDVTNRELIFTFWGTSDGRHGYYTAPQVLSWSGYGETQYIQTTSLAPGEKECQSPHPGATTSFDYFVEYADGEIYEKTYTSVYRSLPWICLIGVSELSDDCANSGNCTYSSQEDAQTGGQSGDTVDDGTDTEEQTVDIPGDESASETTVVTE